MFSVARASHWERAGIISLLAVPALWIAGECFGRRFRFSDGVLCREYFGCTTESVRADEIVAVVHNIRLGFYRVELRSGRVVRFSQLMDGSRGLAETLTRHMRGRRG